MDEGNSLTDLLTARNSISIGRRIATAEAAMRRRVVMTPTRRRSGVCFPSDEAIAAKAECARSAVGRGGEGATSLSLGLPPGRSRDRCCSRLRRPRRRGALTASHTMVPPHALN
jgi:hypothetical protein